jgi:hypothetical protein
MALSKSIGKTDLDKKFQKVAQAPEGFVLFKAIHDFIEHIETIPAFVDELTHNTKINRELNIPTKYGYLRQIYQAVEDAHTKTTNDLGHTRYMNIRDIVLIEKQEFSENNTFWKKRVLFRKLAGEMHARLTVEIAA